MIRSPFIAMLVFAALAGGCASEAARRDPVGAAEARAIDFLKREVPAWPRDNGCFSCHNNGDAARALYAALRRGYRIPSDALADTTAWVARPEQWEHNQGDPGFSDQRLADVQFAASLAAAIESGALKSPQVSKVAAVKVAQAQSADGSWPIDVGNAVGSPATYGATLATYMAWDTLRRVSLPEIVAARLKAETKLRAIKPDTVPNAAVLLLFWSKPHEGTDIARDASSPRQSLEFLNAAQTSDGGWGPYSDSPPEAFDTALALLALAEFRTETGVMEMIQRGREFLRATQQSDGSWPATTRPSGGQSYAQQMSTTGWATLALLATR